ncbi:MAG: hypothetical protein V4504_01925 [Patescibacteria group bacterium]
MKYRKLWKPKESALEDTKSLIILAKSILEARDVIEKHKKYLLDEIIWKITEVHGKYNQRFVSECVWNDELPILEHVIERKKLIKQILENPYEVEKILISARTCLVTREEHKRLKEADGWDRYKLAQIKVFDRLKQNWFDFNE